MQRGLPAAAGVFLASLSLLLLGMERTALIVYDEGVIAYGAVRLLAGELPYRDFWTVYGPGQFWAVAGLFKIFGASLLVERVWDALVRAGIALVGYLIAARLASRTLAVLAWLIILGWLWATGHHGYPLLPAALLVMLGALLFTGFALEPGRPRRLVLAGIAVGAAAVFRHDVGFYAFLSIALSLAVFRLRGAPIALGRSLALFTAGVLAAGLPAAAYLLISTPFAELWSQLIVFPATVYAGVRSLPYPSALDYLFMLTDLLLGGWSASAAARVFSMLAFFFPCAVLALAALSLAKTWPGSAAQSGRGPWISLFALTVLASLLFLASLVRPDEVHLAHVIVLSLVIAAPALGRPQAGLHRVAVVLVAIGLGAMAAHPLLKALERMSPDRSARWTVEAAALPRASGLRIWRDQALAIDYVRSRVAPEEKIFVGNGRHDMSLISDVLFYFLAERGAASKFHELHPGLSTTAEVQKRIVADLATVNYIVMYTGELNTREPNLSSRSSGVEILDRYLLQNYREEVIFGRYHVWRRE